MKPRAVPAPTWTLRATYVPPGARVADGLTLVLYMGPDEEAADGWIDFLEAFAEWSRCAGVIVVRTSEGGEERGNFSIRCYRPNMGEGVRPSGGYPSHGCGSPLVPGDVVRQACGRDELFCVGCLRAVKASPGERLRATTAASHERAAARAS